MSAAPPRYRQLADVLRQDILNARLKPGAALPTEMEICAEHDVSRHTAREALRILTEDGLIERRRGAGTIVAGRKAPAFAQTIGDFDSILQYARDAKLTIFHEGSAAPALLDRFGLTGEFREYVGLRRVADEPAQAITTVLLSERYALGAAELSQLSGPVSEWLEQKHRVSIVKVTQRMEAAMLNAAEAQRLGVPPHSAALRTTRRYRNASGSIVLLSESLHPAGRFAYEIRLERKRP
ncbi:MAG: GntR family transcriptional regulator [Parvularculaceae bacterium]|nr:GntR family transcriptional regulator [Parvularculaceae bacterium]